MAYTQTGRSISIKTPLGKDALLLQGFTGTEAISRLFHFSMELLSENSSIAFDSILGRSATITVKTADGGERHFNGVVNRFVQRSSDKTLSAYTAEMVPTLWLLTRSADCRVFQNQTAVDIIKKIFSERGVKDVKYNLTKTYPTREYCVQYRETDFNFVSRLMEHHGIFYYFEHTKDTHTVVLGDASSEHKPVPGASKVRFQRTQGAAETQVDVVTDWTTEQEIRSTKQALTDFNFQTPRVSLAVSRDPVHASPGGQKFEVYDYPGEYDKKDLGEQIVRLRTEEDEAERIVARGASTCRQFSSGYKFDMTEYPRGDVNKSYVLTAVAHSATDPSYVTGPEGETPSYSNTFTCQPAATVFRPGRLTPRPSIHGLQTAIAVGKSGEELFVDKFGRIKVQFHWDRLGKHDENSSCWIRVAQSWAGKRWGFVFLPRIGQEVLVEFLEGDPDQPLIMGAVYNGDNNPPYDLPSEQTKSTVKSNSSKGGGGFNELRFEDKKDSEQVYLHGQKDLDIIIEKDRRELIKGKRHQIVKGEKVTSVDGEHHLKVGSNQVAEIGGSASEKVSQSIYIKGGTSVVIEAGIDITIKGGGGFVKVDPMGVTISGTLVNINSGGSAGSGSASSVKTPDEPKP
jgi:type VI secretion system secreted protein VgrG